MAKFLFKWLFRLLLLVIVLVVALVLLLDTILKEICEYRLEQQTGLEVSIGKVEVGLLRPKFRLENLVLYNSSAFGGSPLAEIPEIHIEYDRQALLDRQVRLTLLRLNVARVEAVMNQQGQMNLQALQEAMTARTGIQPGDDFSKHNTLNLAFGGIDCLNLTIGKLKYTHLGSPQESFELDVGIQHQALTNLRTEKQFADALTMLVFQKAASLFLQKGGLPSPAPPAPAPRGGGAAERR